MSKFGEELIGGMEEAVAIANGEAPAPAVWFDGHRYVHISAVVKERQRCAKIADAMGDLFDDIGDAENVVRAAREIAFAIRAGGAE